MKLGVLGLAALLAIWPMSSPAQDDARVKLTPPGARKSNPWMEAQPSDAAYASARELVRCAVKQQPKRVQALLDADGHEALRASLGQLKSVLTKCATQHSRRASEFELKFSSWNAMGLFSEAWLLKNEVPSLEPASYPPTASDLHWIADEPGREVVLELATCLAKRQPAPVATLLASMPGSTAEAAAFAGVMPLIPACLDSNVMLKTNRNGLRLGLALAYYRRTVTPL